MNDLPIPLVVWGASGHATVVADAARASGRFEVVGFVDDVNPERHGQPFCGSQVVGDRNCLSALRAAGVRHFIFGIGNCTIRLALDACPDLLGWEAAIVVHPRSVVSGSARLGPGTFIAAGAIINPEATLGRHVIVNTAASVDHHCLIRDGSHIAPGAHLAGNVTIGQGAWVGIGATIIEKVRIGDRAVIGAGAVVVSDIPAGVLAYGVPTRAIRQLQQDERY